MTLSGLPRTHWMYLPVALIILNKPTLQYEYQSPFGFRYSAIFVPRVSLGKLNNTYIILLPESFY